MKYFILLCVVASAFAAKCGQNQHYNSCGTACPLTCDNYDNPPKACVLMCNPGCHCDAGYVKTADGECVKPEECPAKSQQVCGLNERYNECGTACPLTCDNYKNPPKFCNKMCKIGCECEEGYVRATRAGDKRCVKPEQCPLDTQVCGLNERFTECGTSCPLTCDNYKNPPKFCNLMCNIGCECEEGYVRATRAGDKRCVKPEQCPLDTQVCGLNEHYTECGTSCPLTCDNHKNPPKMCNLMCNSGCFCDEGYVRATRASDKRCVKPAQCPLDARYKLRQSTEACDLPAETGVCRGFFPRFYFDRTTGQCEKFIYGGCGGNENNFESVEECQQACDVQASEDVCELPSETGLCRGYFPRYYFNKISGQCEKFVYGGCGGNGNNFHSLEDCQKTCS